MSDDRPITRTDAGHKQPSMLHEAVATLRDVDSRLTAIEARVKATNERLDELMNTLRGI